MTEQDRREQVAQPSGAAQPGQHKTDPPGEPVTQSGPPPDSGSASTTQGDKPEQPFVVRDKRRKPSPRPRPQTGGGTEAQQPAAGNVKATAKVTPQAAEPTPAADTTATDTSAADTAPAAPAAEDTGAASFTAELEALRSDLEERTRDLQRITAEYANYRRRIERDRKLAAEYATASVLSELLGVLDDLDRARNHGDLVGPFGAVAEQLTSVLTKLGLSPFGEKGDEFDPTRHEAVAHSVSSEVTEPTCVEVFRRGYLHGERLLRPALVAVADPADEEPAQPAEQAEAAPEATAEPASEPAAESDGTESAPAGQGDEPSDRSAGDS